MTASPPKPEGGAADEISPALRAIAYVLLAVPLAGIAAHAVIYLVAIASPEGQEWLREYIHSPALKIIAAVSFVCLVGNWFHYRRTRMTMDVFSRIAIYLWILTIVLLFKVLWQATVPS